MKKINKTLSTFAELSNIEYQTYDLQNRKLIFSSGFAQKLLGYTEQEFKKMSRNFYRSLIHPDDRGSIKNTINKIINSTENEIIESTVRYKKSDGTFIWAYSRQMIIERDSKGKPSIICSVVEDISGFIFLEKQLIEKNKNLKDISWKNSHRLCAPIASIIGLMDMIEEKDMASEQNMHIFHYMKRAVEKLDEVIREINTTANFQPFLTCQAN